MSQRPLHSFRYCEDCKTEHLGAPCGMSWGQRMRSVKLGTEWMPSLNDSRQRGLTRPYYDDELTKDLFGGLDRKERKEQYMDATKGMGALTRNSNDPKHVKAVLGPDAHEED